MVVKTCEGAANLDECVDVPANEQVMNVIPPSDPPELSELEEANEEDIDEP